MKALRIVALALFVSLLVGLAIGTAIRLRLERPTVYIGAHDAPPRIEFASSPVTDHT